MNDSILLRIQNSDDIDEVKRIAAALLGLVESQQRFRLIQFENLHKIWLDDIHDINQLNLALDTLP